MDLVVSGLFACRRWVGERVRGSLVSQAGGSREAQQDRRLHSSGAGGSQPHGACLDAASVVANGWGVDQDSFEMATGERGLIDRLRGWRWQAPFARRCRIARGERGVRD